jgi:hypothetical protein
VDYAKKKGKGFVIGLSTMFMMDFFILWWKVSQIRQILDSRNMLTHKTTGIGVVKILMPTAFTTKR